MFGQNRKIFSGGIVGPLWVVDATLETGLWSFSFAVFAVLLPFMGVSEIVLVGVS